MTTLWIAITIIGVATYATRVVPLFWLRPNGVRKQRSSWLERLGPCLLAAMAVSIILPTLAPTKDPLAILAAAGGLMSTAGSMWFRRDPGLATVIGVTTFYMISL